MATHPIHESKNVVRRHSNEKVGTINKVLKDQTPNKDNFIQNDEDKYAKAITTDSLSAGFIAGSNKKVLPRAKQEKILSYKGKIKDEKLIKILNDNVIYKDKAIPKTVEELVKLKGVGEVTAKKILKILG